MKGGNKSLAVGLGIGTVVLLGIGTFVLALETFPKRLQAPFHLLPAGSLRSATFQGDLTLSDALLDTKDTDRDGLSDSQELQVYKTSPFLEDSDSDGLNDKGEIDNGEDPNCPKGTDCRALRFPSAREAEQEQVARSLYSSTLIAKLSQLGIPGVSDASTIRTFLKQAGISEEVLKQFDDQTLLSLWQSATQGDSPPTPLPLNPAPQGSGALPESPPASAIRQLLISSGMDKAVLDKFDDEQLVKVYQDTLKEINTKTE